MDKQQGCRRELYSISYDEQWKWILKNKCMYV